MVVKVKIFVAFGLIATLHFFACGNKNIEKENEPSQTQPNTEINEGVRPPEIVDIKTGAERVGEYLPLLHGKKIALAVNQTSMIGPTHLVDSLLALGVEVENIFAPEHGFRGQADAGEQLQDGVDTKTGLRVISLYGKKKKPTGQDLAGIDLVIFDIQDVGARFYTYISAMSYLMEACAENRVPMLILDRPNPNGHYVDGPVLEEGYESYVGLHRVPVVHGMTVGEYAQMVNGEGWLANGIQCELSVIACENYDHSMLYELPVKPSPNLPNIRSVLLYPSICFFEGTNVSVGRGTDKQFQVIGMPDFPKGDFTFTPQPMAGAKYPKHEGKLCRGFDLTMLEPKALHQDKALNISYLIDFYENCHSQNDFFLKNNFFDKLAGGATLRKQILAGKTEKEIRESWQSGLEEFKTIREKYLLYD